LLGVLAGVLAEARRPQPVPGPATPKEAPEVSQ